MQFVLPNGRMKMKIEGGQRIKAILKDRRGLMNIFKIKAFPDTGLKRPPRLVHPPDKYANARIVQ